MISLYPHQEDFIGNLRQALSVYQSVLAQASTGFGKTIVASYMAKSSAAKGKRIIFTVHRKDLITQTAKTFDKFGIKYGYIAAGYRPDPYQQVQVASIATLKNRLERVYAPDLLVIDEAHLAAAKTWAKIANFYRNKNCKIVGLSASPWRLSGEGLDSLFDTMVQGPSMEWLIENKYLSDYTIYAPSTPNLSSIHSRMGDYVNKELEATMDTKTLTGNAVKHWLKYAKDKKTLAFCVSIKHSQHVAAQFRANGITATHIDGETCQEDRMKAFKSFADGDIKVITSVAIFSEGFDLSSQVDREVPVEAVILLRPTQSLTLYLQQIGRSLRAKPYPAIILDHSGNALRFGLPDDEREWSLKGRKGRGSKNSEPDINIRQCPKCFHVHRPAPVCPKCGHVYLVETKLPEHVEGELEEVDKVKMRRKRSYEESKCVTYEDFVRLGKARGYNHPNAWARIRAGMREKRRGR